MANIESENYGAVLKEFEQVLGPILSPRQPMEYVENSLLLLEDDDLDFSLHWLKVLKVSNIELAYSFSTLVGQARQVLGKKALQLWLHESLSLYDREGLYPAISALRDIHEFKKRKARSVYSCTLEEVKPRLNIFLQGLSGRNLNLSIGEDVFTDTENIFLPKSITRFKNKTKNRALYKAISCFLWAQTWYGTFRRFGHSSEGTFERLEKYKQKERAKHVFLRLENIRLLAAIKRDLPGLYREMSLISPLIIPTDNTWKTISQKLEKADASVEDSFDLLDTLLKLDVEIVETDYQGSLNLIEVESKISKRKNQTITELEELLNKKSINQKQLEEEVDSVNNGMQGINDEGQGSQSKESGESDVEGGGSSSSSRLRELIATLMQDVDKLETALFDELLAKSDSMPGSVTGGSEGDIEGESILNEQCDSSESKILEVDEWDYLRQNYRKRWCQVRVRQVDPGDGKDFKYQTETKYPFLKTQIRKVFEAMRDQPKYANRQKDGDEVDLDAVVDMYTARKAGEELSERMYIRRLQNERNVSVCLLVDMSGSTKGWINLAMRESLVLLSEALNTLGDQYAIFGFSGLTRQRCEVYTVKGFDDPDSNEALGRISNIQAKDYTRMGFAVRYATQKLLKTEVKHRILLMLSDGKPDDYDGYQGEYGIQDTRKAILEAQGQSINLFSITIDKQAQVYLPRLFGPGQYMILDDVGTLPLKLSEVYWKISGR